MPVLSCCSAPGNAAAPQLPPAAPCADPAEPNAHRTRCGGPRTERQAAGTQKVQRRKTCLKIMFGSGTGLKDLIHLTMISWKMADVDPF